MDSAQRRKLTVQLHEFSPCLFFWLPNRLVCCAFS
jgi:hypothetical protein